ncbi:LysR family transcriptional regulator [Microbacterium sp.]|uniref:LysR family transcriptional regulator n=2 Tax=unclassified Microbacterium TaxID=2609290 RepID=UPI003451CAFB
MKINDLRRFVAMVDAGLHAPRAAENLGVPLASLYTSLEKLESDVGHPILSKEGSGWRLTPAGTLLLDEARAARQRTAKALQEAPGALTTVAPREPAQCVSSRSARSATRRGHTLKRNSTGLRSI